YATERNTSSAVITTLREAGAELGDAIKVVSARQLFNDYMDNEIKAKLDYTGKELLVTGAVVREIGRRRDSRMFVELTAGFTCYFLRDQEYELAKLNKGDTISIKGECIGSHKDFRLEGCSVQR
ncbi:MAG: hypothetical protein QF489_05490, partial [Planctomycetota bacterium]|nr:hypothetical protein [Planctomycetota bacterium]